MNSQTQSRTNDCFFTAVNHDYDSQRTLKKKKINKTDSNLPITLNRRDLLNPKETSRSLRGPQPKQQPLIEKSSRVAERRTKGLADHWEITG